MTKGTAITDSCVTRFHLRLLLALLDRLAIGLSDAVCLDRRNVRVRRVRDKPGVRDAGGKVGDSGASCGYRTESACRGVGPEADQNGLPCEQNDANTEMVSNGERESLTQWGSLQRD